MLKFLQSLALDFPNFVCNFSQEILVSCRKIFTNKSIENFKTNAGKALNYFFILESLGVKL